MTVQTGYCTASDLVSALGKAPFMAIFDDDNTGDETALKTSVQVLMVLQFAHAETASWLPDIYKAVPVETAVDGTTPSAAISQLLRTAELGYAVAFSYRRHPEYARTYGAGPDGSLFKECIDRMQRIVDAVQRVPKNDNPPEATPETLVAVTVDPGYRIMVNSPDGTSNAGDF